MGQPHTTLVPCRKRKDMQDLVEKDMQGLVDADTIVHAKPTAHDEAKRAKTMKGPGDKPTPAAKTPADDSHADSLPQSLCFDSEVEKQRTKCTTAYPGKKGRLPEWIPRVAQFFFSTRGNMLDLDALLAIAKDARAVLRKEQSLKYVDLPANGSITIVGDMHGYYDDAYTILQSVGVPSMRNHILFNGDIVDRGPKQLQIATMVLLLKVAYPKFVHITKGNHESRNMQDGEDDGKHSFVAACKEAETMYKWEEGDGERVYEQFLKAFDQLPLSLVLNDLDRAPCVFVVHGGLPEKADTEAGLKLEDIAKWDKEFEKAEGEANKQAEQLLWNDPTPKKDLRWSRRRSGMTTNERGDDVYLFGAGVSQKFLADNDLRLIVRSHEEKKEGYEFEHIRGDHVQVVSVFSIPSYEGSKNMGAFLRIPGAALGPDFEVQEAMAVQFPTRSKMTQAKLAALQKLVDEADSAAEERPKVARKLAFTPPRKMRGTGTGDTPSKARNAAAA